MIFALLHGEEFPAFTTNFLPWQPHAWRLLPGGDFLSLFRKECFYSFQIFSFFLTTFFEVTFSHRKKIAMLPFPAERLCNGNILPSPHTAWARR
jgi:hypothetical protein